MKGKKLVTTFDEYTVGRQLGQGGAGTVFEARSTDGATVAVKLLRPNLPIEKTKRFKNEIAFCQGNWHQGIVRVLDHGVFDENEKRLFYVMPLYAGTFRTFIAAEKASEKLVLGITKILDAVEAAHLRGCYHRDIKPENILVDISGTQFVVSDFGVAHFEEEDLITPVETLHADRLANFQYAAPEQRVRGGAVDHRADIFALGLILNEAFTKLVPHGAGYTRIQSVYPELGYLDEVADKMMQQNPSNRYQSVAEVKGDLLTKGKIAISFQKVNSIQKSIIPEFDVSDNPLVSDPVKVIDVDHDGKNLVCRLNHSIPDDWQKTFYNRGANSWTSMHAPNMVSFHSNRLNIQTPIEQASQAKGLIDQWINGTNQVYRELLQEQQRKESSRKRRELEAEAEFERKRQAFLKQIKV